MDVTLFDVFFVFLLIIKGILELRAQLDLTITIQTKLGAIRGIRNPRPTDQREDWHFLGVPYALAPVGDRRFEPPVARAPWTGVLQADRYGPACSQQTGPSNVWLDQLVGVNEDCLYLNIITHNSTAAERLLPVLVFLHGGQWLYGSSHMSPQINHYADKDILVVTVNYRLGPLGFLGRNYGILDQVLALEWVRDNVGDYGGDAGRVTLMGHEVGGQAVTLHMLAPRSADLFQRAIVLDKVAPWPYAPWTEPTASVDNQLVQSIGTRLGCEQTAIQDVMQCLRTKPVDNFFSDEIMELLKTGSGWTWLNDGELWSQDPTEMWKEGRINPKPLLVGFRRVNGFNTEMNQALFQRNVKDIITRNEGENEVWEQSVVFEYTTWNEPTDRAQIGRQYQNLLGDLLYAPLVKMMDTYSAQIKSPSHAGWGPMCHYVVETDDTSALAHPRLVFGDPRLPDDTGMTVTWLTDTVHKFTTANLAEGTICESYNSPNRNLLLITKTSITRQKNHRQKQMMFWNTYKSSMQQATDDLINITWNKAIQSVDDCGSQGVSITYQYLTWIFFFTTVISLVALAILLNWKRIKVLCNMDDSDTPVT